MRTGGRKMKAEPEIEGGGSTWWYVCPECHTAVTPRDPECPECGQELDWIILKKQKEE